MARTFFVLLLLLNILALAWLYLKDDEHINAGREPQRANSGLAADKIRLLTPAANSPDEQTLAAPTAASAVAAESCRAYAGATTAEANEIITSWQEKLAGARVTANPVIPAPVFDIAITGLTSRTAAEAKIAELKKLGIGQPLQIQFGDDKHFSVSLGSFAEQHAADEALKNVTKLGIRSAVIVKRQPVPQQSIIEVRGNETTLKLLTDLATARKGLTSTECVPQ